MSKQKGKSAGPAQVLRIVRKCVVSDETLLPGALLWGISEVDAAKLTKAGDAAWISTEGLPTLKG